LLFWLLVVLGVVALGALAVFGGGLALGVRKGQKQLEAKGRAIEDARGEAESVFADIVFLADERGDAESKEIMESAQRLREDLQRCTHDPSLSHETRQARMRQIEGELNALHGRMMQQGKS
jgi:vacuolar-type H+-ATPase subunit H